MWKTLVALLSPFIFSKLIGFLIIIFLKVCAWTKRKTVVHGQPVDTVVTRTKITWKKIAKKVVEYAEDCLGSSLRIHQRGFLTLNERKHSTAFTLFYHMPGIVSAPQPSTLLCFCSPNPPFLSLISNNSFCYHCTLPVKLTMKRNKKTLIS